MTIKKKKIIVLALVAILTSIGLLASIILRSKITDQDRIKDLVIINTKIKFYYNQHIDQPNAQLPNGLADVDLNDDMLIGKLKDYKYEANQTTQDYKICTDFKTEALAASETTPSDFDIHPAEYHCYGLSAKTSAVDHSHHMH